MRLLRGIPRLILLCCVCACSSTTKPDPEPAPTVTLALSVEPVFRGGYEITRVWATFENVSLDSVTVYPSCGDSYWFVVSNDLGEGIRVDDPATGHLCPRDRPFLYAGESIEYWVDVGLAWTDVGEQYLLPAGDYEVEVEVLYSAGGRLEQAEDAALIEWSIR